MRVFQINPINPNDGKKVFAIELSFCVFILSLVPCFAYSSCQSVFSSSSEHRNHCLVPNLSNNPYMIFIATIIYREMCRLTLTSCCNSIDINKFDIVFELVKRHNYSVICVLFFSQTHRQSIWQLRISRLK